VHALPTIAWIWTIGIVAVLGFSFGGLILWMRRWHTFSSLRRTAVIAIWIITVTVSCWLLFMRADAQAAAIHGQNIFIGIIYIYFWLLAILPAPLLGFALSRLFKKKGMIKSASHQKCRSLPDDKQVFADRQVSTSVCHSVEMSQSL
jgi:hypothetical protein